MHGCSQVRQQSKLRRSCAINCRASNSAGLCCLPMLQVLSRQTCEPAPTTVCEDCPCCIVARGARDATTGMGARTAHVQPCQRCPVIGMTQHRPGAEQLIERQSAVEDVAADEPERALKIKRAHDL